MNPQEKPSIPPLNLNVREPSVPQQQEEVKPENATAQNRLLDANSTQITPNDTHSVSTANPDQKVLSRQETFFYPASFPAKTFTTKEILLAQQGFEFLGKKKINENATESLLDLPSGDCDQNLDIVPSQILTKSLKNSYRRRSCTCLWCGGSSALEKKVEGLPGFPIPMSLKRKPLKKIDLEEGKGSLNSSNTVKSKYESVRMRDKHLKNVANLKHLVAQVRTTMNDGLSPKLSPKTGNKMGNSPFSRSTTKDSYFEFKEKSGEMKADSEEKSPTKNINQDETALLGNNAKIAVAMEKNNAIKEGNMNVLNKQVKKKIVIKKKDLNDLNLSKKLFNSTFKKEISSATYRDTLPKLLHKSVIQKKHDESDFDKMKDIPREIEKDQHFQKIKKKLKRITGRKPDWSEHEVKKIYGVLNSDTRDHLKTTNNHTVSDFQVPSLNDRSRSLPMNQALEMFKTSRLPLNKIEATEQTRLQSLESEMERPLKKRPPKLKFKKTTLSGFESPTGLSVKSFRFKGNSPFFSNFKIAASARLKSEAKTEWLLKNYNSKVVIKKETNL